MSSYSSFAAPEEWETGSMRIKYEYQHFIIKNTEKFTEFRAPYSSSPVEGFCTDSSLKGVEQTEKKQEKKWEVNKKAIQKYLQENIAPEINQDVSNVVISQNESGVIQFEGYGYNGVELDIKISSELIAYAIQNNIDQVNLAVIKTPSTVTVHDGDLKKMGIKEVIAVGRSDFYPSSAKRIQNIMAGAARFNGYIIQPGEEFSFNTQLGDVDKKNGYAKEYVILGPKVLKEYGGGLCQVSSTAYRGVMLSGLEVTERHNHSFAVSHYKPYGSDATIYQGVKDFKFKNDTTAAILIQTRRGGKKNSELFFHYYGTSPKREVKIFGPQIGKRSAPLPQKTTYSESLPEGTSRKVSGAVPGLNASFERTVSKNGEQKFNDSFHSPYQPRGLWIIKGGEDPATQVSSGEAIRSEEELIFGFSS